MYTPLHRLVGAPPGPLTLELLQAAIEVHLLECQDLEWKRDLPLTRWVDHAGREREELAKDVAAMANGGGGIIVYGVGEAKGAAANLHPVSGFSDEWRRRLRQCLGADLHPPVYDVDVRGIDNPANGQVEAVALLVPDSVDAPHLVFKDGKFGAPRRDGSRTDWMNERSLEQAYYRRWKQRDDLRTSLLDDYSDLQRTTSHFSQGDLTSRTWILAAARPVRHQRRTLDLGSAFRAITAAPPPDRLGLLSALLLTHEEPGATPRRGLRSLAHRSTAPRLTSWSQVFPNDGWTGGDTYLSLGDQGSYRLGVSRFSERYPPIRTSSNPGADDLTQLVLDLATLSLRVRRALGVDGDYRVLVGTTTPEKAQFVIRVSDPTRPDPTGPAYANPPTAPAYFPPVEATLSGSDLSSLASDTHLLLDDLLAQAELDTPLTQPEILALLATEFDTR